MHRIHTLVCLVAFAMGGCQPKQDLNRFVTKPVLGAEATKTVYLADTKLRLTVPENLIVEEKQKSCDGAIYSFRHAQESRGIPWRHAGDRLFDLHLSVSLPRGSGGSLGVVGAKQVYVGPWKGLFQEIKQGDGNFGGMLLLDLKESWFERFFFSLGQRIRVLRARLGIPPHETDADMDRVFKEGTLKGLRFRRLSVFWYDLLPSEHNLLLEITASLDVPSRNDPVFTSIVDWYKPPPREIFDSLESTGMDSGLLIVGVPPLLHNEAIALLGDEDVVELTEEQAEYLSFGADPDTYLRRLIRETIRTQEDQPEQSLKEIPERDRQSIINTWESDRKRFEELEGRLKPYLIKAVTLGETRGFAGLFLGDDLLIDHGAMGNHPVPMRRMPVVAFLPKKPHKIYTTVSMME